MQSMIATKQADLAQLMVEEEAVAKMVQEAKQGAATTPQGLFAKLASEKEQELLRVNRGEWPSHTTATPHPNCLLNQPTTLRAPTTAAAGE